MTPNRRSILFVSAAALLLAERSPGPGRKIATPGRARTPKRSPHPRTDPIRR